MRKYLLILSLIYFTLLYVSQHAKTYSLFKDSNTSSINLIAAAQTFPKKDVTQQIQSGDVVINEINWAGSVSSGSADEWMELRNMTNNPINLNGWKITHAATNNTDLALNGTIPANALFLISNYSSANSAINIIPDLITTSVSLINSDTQYKLIDNNNNIIDIADDGTGAPLAGSNGTSKASMERNTIPGDGILLSNWHTATTSINFDLNVTDKGTPKAANN